MLIDSNILKQFITSGKPEGDTWSNAVIAFIETLEHTGDKTRSDEFLRLHPRTELDDNTIAIFPCSIDVRMSEDPLCERFKKFKGCVACRQAYWSEEL